MKQVNNKVRIFILFSFLFIGACSPEKQWDCIKSSGPLSSKIIIITSPFQNIIIDGYFKVVLHQSKEQKIKFSGGKHLLYKVSAHAQNDTLFIENNNSCLWARKYNTAQIQVDLYAPDFHYISTLKPTDLLSADTLHLQSFTFDMWGHIGSCHLLLDCRASYLKLNAATGHYFLAGKTDFNYIFVIGSGNVYSDQLVAQRCFIHHDGDGEISFYAIKQADIELYNTGNVYYKTKPEQWSIQKQPYATGNVIPLL